MTRFILVRHGQTVWNRVERFRGQADIPLDDTGRRQAAATGEWVAAEWQPSAIYASPLQRAVQTAEATATRTGLAVQPVPGLLDMNFGEWQGLTPDEARARWPEAVSAWFTAPQLAQIPGGESLDTVRARAMAQVRELAALHADETVVMVGHTVVNRVILLGVLGLGNERYWRLGQETCAINVFETQDDDFNLITLNATCHLRALAQDF